MRCPTIVAPFLVAAALLSGVAHADDANKTRARESFTHAVALFDDKRFADSLDEFVKSYALAPVFSTLYNIGLVHAALGHPVEAVDAFERYLAQGGAAVPADKRLRVEAELAVQRAKIGEILLTVSPAGAEIRFDGKVVGKTPLGGPFKAGAGHHTVEAMLDGYRPQSRDVQLQGKGRVEITLQLEAIKPKETPPTVAAVLPIAPAPAPVPPAAAPVPAAPAPPVAPAAQSDGKTQRILGWGLGVVGLAGAGVGIVVAVKGQDKHNDALDQWWAGDHAGAYQTESDANSRKTAGGVTIAAGSVLFLCGGVLLLTAPPSQRKVGFEPWLSPSVAGAGARGAF